MKNKLYLMMFIWLAGVCPVPAQVNPDEFLKAGNTAYTSNDYKLAIQYYEAALDANPRIWQAFQGLGNCYYAMGDKAKALLNYQRCLSLHPDNPALASFAASLRSETEASKTTSKSDFSKQGTEKFWRAASGISEEHFELSPSIGIVAASGSGLGFGFGSGGFYMFDTEFGVGGLLHLYLFNTAFSNASSLEIVPAIIFKAGGKAVRPFLVAGGGFTLISASYKTNSYSYDTNSSSGNNSDGPVIYPILEAGGGLEFPIQPDMSLFVEGRVDCVIGSYSSDTYVPLEMGLNFNLK